MWWISAVVVNAARNEADAIFAYDLSAVIHPHTLHVCLSD
jgi:hypothetical protein